MALSVSSKKTFKGFSLDVDFNIKTKKTGILGASGSGKSMTLKIISGLINPDEGKIINNDTTFFDSEKKINIKPQKRKVGFLFQDYALFPHMTIYENISIGIKDNKKNITEKVNTLLEKFMISEHRKKYPRQLSGGQQQRVALARIFANDPDILLVDEAFSSMDYYLKEQLQIEFLETLKDFKGTVLIVTHDMGELYNLCDDVIVLHDGKSICMDSTKNIFSKPKFLSVAKLTGCRNFSKIKKIENKIKDKFLYAIDWDLHLKVSEKIDNDITYIGIRDTSFYPSNNLNGINCFPINITEKIENPFEYKILFSHKNSKNKMWCKFSKNENMNFNSKNLCVKPEDIMLLKNNI